MTFPRLLHRTLALCLFAALASTAAADPAEAITKGQRVFTCGHSFHVWVAPMLTAMATAAGISDHEMTGLSSIGGSTVQKHWDVADEKNLAKKALREGRVDVLTLSPIWLPDAGIESFATLAVQHNPAVRITVQEYWLPNDEYVPVYPLQTKKKVDHNATNLTALRAAHEKYFHDIEAHVRELNVKLGNRPNIYIVPVGQAVLALREKIAAGQAPGITAQEELFRDSWGHPNEAIRVLSAYCHFAVIYRRSPVGLPTPALLAKGSPSADALNRLLQELAWQAVARHPMSGISVKH